MPILETVSAFWLSMTKETGAVYVSARLLSSMLLMLFGTAEFRQ